MDRPRRQTVSIDQIKDALLAQIDQVVHHYAPPAPGSYTKAGQYFTLNPGRYDRSVGSFVVQMDGAKAGKWQDFATGAHGDLIDLIGLGLNLTPAQAIAEARSFLGLETESPDQRRAREAAAKAAAERRAAQAREARAKADRMAKAAQGLWLSAQEGLRGTPVADYLAARGLDLAGLGRQPRALRFHPETLYFAEQVDPETGEVTTRRVKLPAMVAAITDGKGNHIATHRTYLARGADGVWRKAALPDAKKVLGDYRGGCIRLSSGHGPRGGKGAPLNDCPPGTRVYIAEGIETGLSALMMRPDIRVLAAISLSNMGAVELPANVAEVVLIADADTHPQAQAALQTAVQAHADAGRVVRVRHGGVDA
jgi:hypothetical protein